MPELQRVNDLVGVHAVVSKISTMPYGVSYAVVLGLEQHMPDHADIISEDSRIEGKGVTVIIGEDDLRTMCETTLARLNDTKDPLPRLPV
jgi:hypothetical protein